MKEEESDNFLSEDNNDGWRTYDEQEDEEPASAEKPKGGSEDEDSGS